MLGPMSSVKDFVFIVKFIRKPESFKQTCDRIEFASFGEQSDWCVENASEGHETDMRRPVKRTLQEVLMKDNGCSK